MVSENLLATYSLLSFIQDSQKVNKGKSILQLFIPIVQETLNWMLSQKATNGVIMGKSTLEIRDAIKARFELEIPPVALNSILSLIDTDKNRFVINSDKSFIIDVELFSLGDESDGTKRLFDYIPLILDLIQGGKVFVVDEMERSLHPALIQQIITLFYKYSKDVSSQLIFTTHESSLMNQKVFRKDEIWLMRKSSNGISSFGRMDNLYNVRFDKMLQNSYLNGEYGATPIFETEEEISKLFSTFK